MTGRARHLARRVRAFWPRRAANRILRRFRRLDGPTLSIPRARLRLGTAPVIVECGANTGSDTVKFLARWPDARIYCFEPEPRAIAEWRATVTSPRATLFEVALAAVDGETTFHRSSGRRPSDSDPAAAPWNQSGSIRRPTGHLERWPWVTFEETITVATRSLDSWAVEHGIDRVDLIWADVQGAEEDLVRGGLATLSRTRYLYTEVADEECYEGQIDLPGLLALLPGWKVVARFPNDVLVRA